MGTPKRERQKANRQARLEVLQAQQKRKKATYTGLKVGAAVVGLVVVAIVLALTVGKDDDTDEVVSPGTAVTVPGSDGFSDTSTAETGTTVALPTPVSVEPGASVDGETPCPAEDGSSERTTSFTAAPPMCIDEAKTYTAVIDTNKGPFTVELDAAAAPLTVNNFVVLARYHFYDGVGCHRIIADFAIQCGDPTGTGRGGPGYAFDDELPASADDYKVGSLAMANSGPGTNGSQFFVVMGEGRLTADYSLFGAVTEGLDTSVQAIEDVANLDPAANGVPPLENVIINSVTITES